MAAQEFTNCVSQIKKLKGGYSAIVSLIFQSWLKDIRVYVEDWNLMEMEAILPVEDFTAKCACDEVEFYTGMGAEDQKTF